MKLHHESHPRSSRRVALAAHGGITSLAVLLIASTALGPTRVRAESPVSAEQTPREPDPAKSPQPRAGTPRWRVPEPNLDPQAVAAAAMNDNDARDPRGSLGWEIFGGVVPAVSGIVLIVRSIRGGTGGGHVPSFRVDMPTLVFGSLLTILGPAAGVSIAGHATGGSGSAGFAYLGTLAGLPLSVPGMVAGSVIGYRLSAEPADPPRRPASAADVMLQIDGKL